MSLPSVLVYRMYFALRLRRSEPVVSDSYSLKSLKYILYTREDGKLTPPDFEKDERGLTDCERVDDSAGE